MCVSVCVCVIERGRGREAGVCVEGGERGGKRESRLAHLVGAHLQHHVHIDRVLKKGLKPHNVLVAHAAVDFDLSEQL